MLSAVAWSEPSRIGQAEPPEIAYESRQIPRSDFGRGAGLTEPSVDLLFAEDGQRRPAE